MFHDDGRYKGNRGTDAFIGLVLVLLSLLGGASMLKYLLTDTTPSIHVEIGDIDASTHTDIDVQQKTDCGLFSWNCKGE